MESWPQVTAIIKELSLAAAAIFVVYAIVFKEWVWTRGRSLEWVKRAEKAEKRAEAAEEALRSNNGTLKDLTSQVEISNKTLSDILKALLSNTDRR